MHCCFCGPIKQCARYLPQVFANIERLGALFSSYSIYVVVDGGSTDGSVAWVRHRQRWLQQQQKQTQKQTQTQKPVLLPVSIEMHVQMVPVSRYRTHRLAHARNLCLEHVKRGGFPYFVMMDFDEVCAKPVHPEVLDAWLEEDRNDRWDALCFNTAPRFYDIWALSIYPFGFSYNHFRNSPVHDYGVLQRHVMRLLQALPEGELLRCYSAFNGFAIYKTEVFRNVQYDGHPRTDLVPLSLMLSHMIAARSRVLYREFGHISGREEDCEHRAFHWSAIRERNAKIMICPQVLFE